MRALRVLLAAGVASSAGCLSPPILPPRPDAGRDVGPDASVPPFAVLALEVTDALGRPWQGAAPRTPHIRITLSSPPHDPGQALLLMGTDDASLDEDLADLPLRAATLARSLPVLATAAGDTLTLIPATPLDPGASVTVALPPWLADGRGARLGAPYTRELTISTSPDAGARASASWPPDGAFDVAPSLALAALRFDGTLDDPTRAVVLAEAGGARVPCSTALVACSMIGWPDGACVELVPLAGLDPDTDYTLSVPAGARDATGARVPAFVSRFSTAIAAPGPLEWLPLGCALGESASPEGCARADDESIVFRGQLSAAARISWRADPSAGTLIAPRGEVTVRVAPLPASTPVTLAIEALDAAGVASHFELPLATTEPLATLSITEVRADPAGVEPRQELVEILNYGTSPVALGGMRLADGPSSAGDALPAISIPPGARALVVGASFDPDDDADGADVPAPPGALLVRVDASIGSGGLSNGGEPLYLRDAMDRWVSAAPAEPAPREGVCTVRTSTSPRVGAPGSFGYDPGSTCTPGR